MKMIECDYCHKLIEKKGRRRYCNDACQQAAYRLRKQSTGKPEQEASAKAEPLPIDERGKP